MVKIFLVALTIASLPIPAFAVIFDYNITLNRIGVDTDEKAYIRTVEQLSHSCAHNVIFFDLTTSSGKAIMTVITAAKMAGKKLHTVTYDVNASNQCWLKAVEME